MAEADEFITLDEDALAERAKHIKAIDEELLKAEKESEVIENPQSEKEPNFFAFLVKIIFFPFTILVWAFRLYARKLRFKLTFKTTALFTALYALVMLGFLLILITSIQNHLGKGNEEYFTLLWITAILLLLITIAVVASVGALASDYMFSPIRRITRQLDQITSENLSMRIDEADSQDELRDLTRQINEMLNELEGTFARQANFVSDASHELKTPIAVIQGYVNLLRRWGSKNPQVLEEGILSIAREAENMKTITEQMLMLTKLGSFTPAEQPFDVSLLIEELITSYKIFAKQRFEFIPREGFFINSDRDLFMQVMRVLIDNAVKYSPPDGTVTINIAATPSQTVVKVKDTGIGISAEDIPHIFERFYRCDKARTREKGGSGLGLSIAKSIMEVLEGDIEVTSEIGKGTVFSVIMYNEEKES